MLEEAPSPHAAPQPASERPSASLLVRCWLEPREDPGAPPILRGYVKNLKTGEETFIKDFDSVGRQIESALGGESGATWNAAAPARSR